MFTAGLLLCDMNECAAIVLGVTSGSSGFSQGLIANTNPLQSEARVISIIPSQCTCVYVYYTGSINYK